MAIGRSCHAAVSYVYEDVHCTATDGNHSQLQKVISPKGRELYYKYADAVGAALRCEAR